MKKLTLLACILAVFLLQGKGQQFPLWSQGNARLEPHGQFTKSLFQPLKYTIIPKLELFTYPLANVYYPNFGMKKFWWQTPERKLLITTKHRLDYPTIALQKVKSPEWGGFYPNTDQPGGMVGFQNELLISKWLKDKSTCKFANYLLTWRLGFKVAFGADPRKLHTLDYPVLFTRTYPYTDKWLLYTGLDLDAHITRSLDFAVDAEFYSAGATMDYFSVEHKGLVLYHLRDNWKIYGGYKMVYGTYPFGPKFSVFPILDVIFHFNLPKGDELKLFDKKIF